MKHSRVALLLGLLFVFALHASAQGTKSITPAEAKDHVGEKATVCGKMVGGRYATSSRGSPTFLNLDKPYPNQVFTIVIWGSDRSKFGNLEETYRDKDVCVTGTISSFKGVPEIIARNPEQVRVKQ